jgi:hypothetical protein
MAIDPNTLFAESQCYLCLGISQAEAIELALLARIAAGGGGPPDGLGAGYTSGLYDLQTALPQPVSAHGLGSVPRIVRMVLVCVINDVGLNKVAGQELQTESAWAAVDGFPNFSVWADATNIYFFNDAARVGFEGDVSIEGSNVASWNNYKLKIYAFK